MFPRKESRSRYSNMNEFLTNTYHNRKLCQKKLFTGLSIRFVTPIPRYHEDTQEDGSKSGPKTAQLWVAPRKEAKGQPACKAGCRPVRSGYRWYRWEGPEGDKGVQGNPGTDPKGGRGPRELASGGQGRPRLNQAKWPKQTVGGPVG